NATKFYCVNRSGMTFKIRLCRCEVRHVNSAPCSHSRLNGTTGHDPRATAMRLGKRGRHVVRGHERKLVSLTKKEGAELGITVADGLFQHGSENWLKIASRARDNLEAVRGSSLVFKGFGEVSGPLP